jgi:hypothetical protein
MVMIRKKRFKQAVEDFAAKADRPFSAEKAIEAIRSDVSRMPSEPVFEAECVLEEHEDVFLDYDEKSEKDELLFVPRRHFFRGGYFRLVPLESEIHGGYLVPGHRFMPFCSRSVFPPNCRLESEDGAIIPVRRAHLSAMDSRLFFSMMRPDDFIQYLMLDDKANEASLKAMETTKGGTEWSLTVFDMADLYRRTDFRAGDAWVAEIVSWREGHYRVKRMPAAELESFRFAQARWFSDMEQEILAENEGGMPNYDPCEQVARAIFECGSEILKMPGVHVGGFIGAMKSLALTPMGHSVVLWEKGRDPVADRFERTGEFDGGIGTLDAILKDLAVSYSEVEVEAFMRDELFRGGKNLQAVRARILQGRTTVFFDAEQEKAFDDLMAELWEDIGGSYNVEKEAFCGPVRSEALRLIEQATDIIRSMDRKGVVRSKLPMKDLIALTTPVSILTQLVGFLNEPADYQVEEATKIRQMLDSAATLIRDIGGTIEAKTGTKRGTRRKNKNAGGGRVLQIKVSLDHIRPPIWRRVLVSSDITLAALHGIVQAAMGWTDSHLHQFRLGRVCYGVPDSDRDFGGEVEDEAKFTLADVMPRMGMKLRYEYDFGDGWEHTLTLEKTLDPVPGQALPECTAGARACPPEDCGGVGGYYGILEALKKPDDPEHSELIEWLGAGYDPEAFDRASINKRFLEE